MLAGLVLLWTGCGARAAAAQEAVLFDSQWRRALPARPAAAPALTSTRAFVPLEDGTIVAVGLTDGTVDWTAVAATNLALAAGSDQVFFAEGSAIIALSASTGQERWRAVFETPMHSAPYFDAGWLFVGTEDGDVSALRAVDGALLWTLDTGSLLAAPPAPAGERVYVPLDDGRILALDLYAGTVVWTRRLRPPLSSILALDDRLFVGSGDDHLYCLALNNGRDRWRWQTGGDVVGATVVDETRVFFMSRDHTLRALNRSQGSLAWRRPLTTRTIGGPLRSGPFVIVATLSPQLHAFAREDGTRQGGSPAPDASAESRTLMAPPATTSLDGRDAFLLLTRGGDLELLTYHQSETDTPADDDAAPSPVAAPPVAGRSETKEASGKEASDGASAPGDATDGAKDDGKGDAKN